MGSVGAIRLLFTGSSFGANTFTVAAFFYKQVVPMALL